MYNDTNTNSTADIGASASLHMWLPITCIVVVVLVSIAVVLAVSAALLFVINTMVKLWTRTSTSCAVNREDVSCLGCTFMYEL